MDRVLFKYHFQDHNWPTWTYSRVNALNWIKQGIKIKVTPITEHKF
jgi:hypothetical protein